MSTATSQAKSPLLEESALVNVLEAIYTLEADDQTWLQGVLAATMELCGPQLSYVGFFYDAASPQALNVWNVCPMAFPPELELAFRLWQQQTLPPEYVMSTFRTLRVDSSRRTGMPQMGPVLEHLESVGWGDILNVNSLDPSGIGCLLSIVTREYECSPPPDELSVYMRVSQHLAAAFRCRRLLGRTLVPGKSSAPDPERAVVEAIVDSEGRLVHAQGEAAESAARGRLIEAAQAIYAARAEQQQGARAALDRWHPLVDARWTLVETFEEQGRRYLVARENQARTSAPDVLTSRERQVVAQASLGFTNKEIAYGLGISHSTVRVLMARAAAKLGVHSRAELLSHPSLEEMRESRRADP